MAVKFQGGRAVPVGGKDASLARMVIEKHIGEAGVYISRAVNSESFRLLPPADQKLIKDASALLSRFYFK